MNGYIIIAHNDGILTLPNGKEIKNINLGIDRLKDGLKLLCKIVAFSNVDKRFTLDLIDSYDKSALTYGVKEMQFLDSLECINFRNIPTNILIEITDYTKALQKVEIKEIKSSLEPVDERICRAKIAQVKEISFIKLRHKSSLEFLSKLNNDHLSKVHEIEKPKSFVFSVIVNGACFVVWETANTKEATYIWLIANDFDKELRRILSDIETMIDHKNKLDYISNNSVIRVMHRYDDKGDLDFDHWLYLFDLALA